MNDNYDLEDSLTSVFFYRHLSQDNILEGSTIKNMPSNQWIQPLSLEEEVLQQVMGENDHLFPQNSVLLQNNITPKEPIVLDKNNLEGERETSENFV